MKIKLDPVSGLYCREDGTILMPPSPRGGNHTKKFRWAFGCLDGNGYYMIGFHGKQYKVHQVICRAFNGPAPIGKPLVDHINRVKSDNRCSNLRWVSSKENCDNKDYVDQSLEKYGVRSCEDQKVYYAARRAEKRAQGLTMRRGPNGKWGWFPFKRAKASI